MKIVSDGKVLEVPGGVSQDIYSTEERVVGRWIDGKPLYRKCYRMTTPNKAGEIHWIGSCGIPDIDVMTNLIGMIKSASEGGYAYIPANQYLMWSLDSSNKYEPTNLCTLWVDKDRVGMLCMYYGHCNCSVYITLEYTKTTDQATVEGPALTEKSGEDDPFAYDTGLDGIPAVAATTPINSEEA